MLLRGGISVVCAWGTPTPGGAVYIRTKVADGTSPEDAVVGELGAEEETGNCVKLTNAKWSGDKDVRGVAELTILTRQGV